MLAATLPASLPPGAPSSPLTWSPDGSRLAIVKVASPYTGDGDRSTVQLLDVDAGSMKSLTGRTRNESQPLFSPDGARIAHWYPRHGEGKDVNEIYVSPASGGDTAPVTRALDRNVQRAMWMPDGKSMLVSANDGTTTGLWVQPLEGASRRIEPGNVGTAGNLVAGAFNTLQPRQRRQDCRRYQRRSGIFTPSSPATFAIPE